MVFFVPCSVPVHDLWRVGAEVASCAGGCADEVAAQIRYASNAV